MQITSNLSPLEVDVSLDLLSSKLNTAKDILKKELKFQTSEQKEDITEQTISSISIFKDLIIAEMISNKFSPNEEIEQLIGLNSEFKKFVESIKNENTKKEEYLNISYTKDQYSEAISRLYLHFANLKIDELIYEFEESENKNFQLLQEVEDIKKKKNLSEYHLIPSIINLLSEVAQLAEQRTVNPLVVGSSPTLGAIQINFHYT